MKKKISGILGTLLIAAFINACGGGGNGAAPPPPPPPPPPAGPQGGFWSGQSVSVTAADVFTSFEFNASGGFTDGMSPYTATYSNGNAETRGIPSFYISGANAWHILIGTTAVVTFETAPNTLTFHVRMPTDVDVGNVDILDENGALILNVVPTETFQMIDVVRGAGETTIGSIEVTSTSGGDVVIDDLTFGYVGNGFAGATEDIDCLVAESLEFICILNDTVSGDLVSVAGGTAQANGTDISGSGLLVAGLGNVLADGDDQANLTISAGTISPTATLDLTVEAAGTTSTITTTYDAALYERASDLATIEAVYTTFEFLSDPSSFTIDAAGVISGQSANCMFDGQVSIIDAMFNVYDVSVNVTDIANCPVADGTYNGLGLSTDDLAMDDGFAWVSFDAAGAVGGEATK